MHLHCMVYLVRELHTVVGSLVYRREVMMIVDFYIEGTVA